MKKGIGIVALSLLFALTLFGPSLVKANFTTNDELDLASLKPDSNAASFQTSSAIHPAWKKLGLIPGCAH